MEPFSFDLQFYNVPEFTFFLKEKKITKEQILLFDKQLASYLSITGNMYKNTKRQTLKEFYCFLCYILQQFQQYLQQLFKNSFFIDYNPDFSYKNKHSQNVSMKLYSFCSISNLFCAKYMTSNGEELPIPELKVFYKWLSQIIEIEQTLTPMNALFSGYQSSLSQAAEKLVHHGFF